MLLYRLNENNLSVYHTAWRMLNTHSFPSLSAAHFFPPFSRNPAEYISIVIHYTILSTFTYIGIFHYKKF